MTTFLKRWPIAASVTLALAFAAFAHTRQTSSSNASKSPSTTTHHRRSSRRRHSRRMHLPAAPSPDRISEIQSALARGGYYKGDPNGKWDSDTIAATEKFQSANGLDSTGKLDAPTLQKLGLGSDIAGVSAPKPVVPNCCSAPSSAAPSGSTAPPSSDHAAPAAPPLTASPAAPAASASNTAVSDPKSPQH